MAACSVTSSSKTASKVNFPLGHQETSDEGASDRGKSGNGGTSPGGKVASDPIVKQIEK